jgi:hypothetical protein
VVYDETEVTMKALHAAPRPCNTCPYRRDTPPGVWHPEEYEKLPLYDDGSDEIQIATFHCHQQNATGVETVCRGWLTVHCESIAARLALITGALTVEQLYADVDVELYATGQEARDAGMAGVDDPDERARRAIDRLVQKGAGRWDD